jgi:hypothetical protein
VADQRSWAEDTVAPRERLPALMAAVLWRNVDVLITYIVGLAVVVSVARRT